MQYLVSRFLKDQSGATAIEYGLYHKHLGRFARLAPDLPMLVLVYEDVVADPAQATRTLADFLSLSVPFNDPEALLAQRANAASASCWLMSRNSGPPP